MLVALLYHRAAQGKYANSPDMMQAHLEHLAKSYPVVLPGDTLLPFKVQVCLTFDDAFFDFYHIVYPLLRKLNLRAILAVPIQYILERTDIPAEVRLNTTYKKAPLELEKAPYCTWEEISEMSQSGYVEIASHSHSHVNLTAPDVDLEKEVLGSKKILENRLNKPISTFVYPYGAFSPKLQGYVSQHYPYAMRIGSASNQGWDPLIYRIQGDHLKSPDMPFKAYRYPLYWVQWFFNKIRNK